MIARAFAVLCLLVSATAFAEGQEPQGPRPRCKVTPATGTPIFEARYTGGAKGRGVITRLYATGTFTRVVTKPKTKPDQRASCIERARLENVTAAIKAASWLTTKSPATCAAVSNEATDILVFGKKRFTAKVCSPLALDDKSSAALDLVAAAVGPFGIDLVDDLVTD